MKPIAAKSAVLGDQLSSSVSHLVRIYRIYACVCVCVYVGVCVCVVCVYSLKCNIGIVMNLRVEMNGRVDVYNCRSSSFNFTKSTWK